MLVCSFPISMAILLYRLELLSWIFTSEVRTIPKSSLKPFMLLCFHYTTKAGSFILFLSVTASQSPPSCPLRFRKQNPLPMVY